MTTSPDGPAAPVTFATLMRLLVQQVPVIARRAVQVPTTRLGTVETFDGSTARVTLDGDPYDVPVQNAVPGGVWPGQRVAVNTYPPHGALVVGVLGALPGIPGEQVWTAAEAITSHSTTSTPIGGWTIATPDGAGGWSDNAGDLECVTPGWWDLTAAGQFESDGGGDHRAFGLALNGAGSNFLNASQQFTAPGGTPTAGYGLSMTAANAFAFEAGDVVTAAARQDSGGPLDFTLRLHLRWIAPA